MIELTSNKDEILEVTKILIYKENPLLFEKLDFNNNDVFLEPLLFAYFNSKSYNLLPKEALEEILQGYFKPRLSNKGFEMNILGSTRSLT